MENSTKPAIDHALEAIDKCLALTQELKDRIAEQTEKTQRVLSMVSARVAADDRKAVVDHPAHYQGAGGLEAIQIIEAWDCGPEFHLAEALAHLLRYTRKDGIHDIKEALWYLKKVTDSERLMRNLRRLDTTVDYDYRMANCAYYFPLDIVEVRMAVCHMGGIFDNEYRLNSGLNQEQCLLRAIELLEKALADPTPVTSFETFAEPEVRKEDAQDKLSEPQAPHTELSA